MINKNILKTLEKEIRDFKTTGTTIHFTPAQPLPTQLIQKIVQLRIQENEEKDALKKLIAKQKSKKAPIL